MKKEYKSIKMKKEDIVKYEEESRKYYGRIVKLELLNGVPCVGVVDTIKISENDEEKYIKEENVEKIIVDDSLTKYLEDTIIDPHSIVTFIEVDYEGFNMGDQVIFCLKKSFEMFIGDIILMTEVNGIPAVVVELTLLPQNFDISKYIINYISSFKDLSNSRKNNLVIVNYNTILKAKTKYFESTVIDPQSVISVEKIDYEEWSKDINVEFRLSESYIKYSGLLKWTGLINKIMAALVEVDIIPPKDSLNDFICSKKVSERINFPKSNNMVIVLLASLNKSNEYLNTIMEFIKNKEFGVDILINIIMTKNSRALSYYLTEWNIPINLGQYPYLLPRLIEEDNYELILILLNQFITSDSDNIHLLNIGKHFLMERDYKSFIATCQTCKNVNVVIEGGETFLTSVMKMIDDEDVINKVIGTNIFDINKANDEGDTPLVLVCRKLMVSCVTLLVNNGANVSYKNNMALNTVMDLRNNTSDPTQLKKILDIIDIITKNIRLDNVVSDSKKLDDSFDNIMCMICMDRSINTAFNCGHTVCDVCSLEVLKCPQCQKNIIDRIRIYLP